MPSTIRIEVDPDEIPRGHSSSLHINNGSRQLYAGQSNMRGDDRKVVTLRLDDWGIAAIGGQTMREIVAQAQPADQLDVATAYVFEWLSRNGRLNEVLNHIAEAGKAQGRKDLRSELAQLISGSDE